MRDERFDHWSTARSYHGNRANEGAAFLRSLEGGKKVIERLRLWWRTVLTIARGGKARTPEFDVREVVCDSNVSSSWPSSSLVGLDLRSTEFAQSLDRVFLRGRNEGVSEQVQTAAQMAHGRSLGLALAGLVPDRICFDVAAELCPHGGWSEFVDKFLRGVRARKGAHGRWSDELADVPATAAPYFLTRGLDELERQFVEREEKEWREDSHPLDIWKEKPSFIPTSERLFCRLGILRKLSLEKWLQAVELLPTPRVAREAVDRSSLSEDREELLRALPLAESVVVAPLTWTGRTAALLVVEQIQEHGRLLMEAFHQHRTQQAGARKAKPGIEELLQKQELDLREELANWFLSGYRTLLRRSDGRAIAVELLAEMTYESGRRGSGDGKTPWTAESAAADALARATAETGLIPSDFLTHWQARESEAASRGKAKEKSRRRGTEGELLPSALRVDGFPYLLAGVSVLDELCKLLVDKGLREGRDSLLAEQPFILLDWFVELLLARDDMIRMVMNPSGSLAPWIPGGLGWLFAHAGDVRAKWFEAWNRLAGQRHQFEFWHHYKDYAVDGPLRLLFRTALSALEWLAYRESEFYHIGAARDFWEDLFVVARGMFLRCSYYQTEHWGLNLSLLFARYSLCFGATDHNHLGEKLRELGPDPELLSSAAWHLWRNGVPLEQVEAALLLADLPLELACAQQRAWVDATRGGREREPALFELLDALEERGWD